MVKKIISIIPFLGMVACTDYQANVEDAWGAQDAAWQEQEYYLNELNAQRACTEGRIVYQVLADSNLVSYVCLNNNWVAYCDDGTVQSYNPTGYVYRCLSKIWRPLTSMENNSSNVQPPDKDLEPVNVLSGGDFKKSCSSSAWEIKAQGKATAEIGINSVDSCELQFKSNSTIYEVNSLLIKNSVNLHYGYSYQIRIQGSVLNASGIAHARVSIKSDTDTFMMYDFSFFDKWESKIKNHCQATQTMTFSLEELDASDFAIQKIEILRRPGNCKANVQ